MRTRSPAPILRAISPYTHRIVSSLSGQSAELCGQPSQVASCGSHSAGMEKPRSAGDLFVSIALVTMRIRLKIGGSTLAAKDFQSVLVRTGTRVEPMPREIRGVSRLQACDIAQTENLRYTGQAGGFYTGPRMLAGRT